MWFYNGKDRVRNTHCFATAASALAATLLEPLAATRLSLGGGAVESSTSALEAAGAPSSAAGELADTTFSTFLRRTESTAPCGV